MPECHLITQPTPRLNQCRACCLAATPCHRPPTPESEPHLQPSSKPQISTPSPRQSRHRRSPRVRTSPDLSSILSNPEPTLVRLPVSSSPSRAALTFSSPTTTRRPPFTVALPRHRMPPPFVLHCVANCLLVLHQIRVMLRHHLGQTEATPELYPLPITTALPHQNPRTVPAASPPSVSARPDHRRGRGPGSSLVLPLSPTPSRTRRGSSGGEHVPLPRKAGTQ